MAEVRVARCMRPRDHVYLRWQVEEMLGQEMVGRLKLADAEGHMCSNEPLLPSRVGLQALRLGQEAL